MIADRFSSTAIHRTGGTFYGMVARDGMGFARFTKNILRILRRVVCGSIAATPSSKSINYCSTKRSDMGCAIQSQRWRMKENLSLRNIVISNNGGSWVIPIIDDVILFLYDRGRFHPLRKLWRKSSRGYALSLESFYPLRDPRSYANSPRRIGGACDPVLCMANDN